MQKTIQCYNELAMAKFNIKFYFICIYIFITNIYDRNITLSR